MIKVDRSKEKIPSCLDFSDPDSSATKEQTKAINHFTGPDKDDKFTFNVYRKAEIKQVFRLLFHEKCAYCESRYASTQPVDVEHFRPKGNVRATPDALATGEPANSPGYFWLAATWENLLPSCIDCNRNRTQPVFISEDGVVSAPGTAKVGKADYFPIEPTKPRWLSHTDSSPSEIPLLLNPCVDDPSEILHYDDFGAVLPSPDLEEGSLKFRKYSASCQVYGLNRLDLVHERRAVLLLLEGRIKSIRIIVELLQNDSDNLKDHQIVLLEDLLAHELKALHHFSESDQPYSLMATQRIERFLKGLTGENLLIVREHEP